MFAALWLLPAIEATLSAAAVLFADMPMLSIYPVLSQKFRLVGFGAAALLAASVCSFATVTVLIALLHWMPGWGLKKQSLPLAKRGNLLRRGEKIDL